MPLEAVGTQSGAGFPAGGELGGRSGEGVAVGDRLGSGVTLVSIVGLGLALGSIVAAHPESARLTPTPKTITTIRARTGRAYRMEATVH